MNAVHTKQVQVLKLNVNHKNLCTGVTAEARHTRTQLSAINKYYTDSFRAVGIIPQSGKSKGRTPQLWEKLSSKVSTGQCLEQRQGTKKVNGHKTSQSTATPTALRQLLGTEHSERAVGWLISKWVDCSFKREKNTILWAKLPKKATKCDG